MKVMTILLIAMAVIYGGLMVMVGFNQFNNPKLKKIALVMMMLGGSAISLSAFIHTIHPVIGFCVLVVGLILVQIAAVQNGISLKGAINLQHHAVRLALSVALCLGYYRVFMI